MLSRILVAAPVLLLSASAFAQDSVPGQPSLPAPGIAGLIAVGILGAVLVARRKK